MKKLTWPNKGPEEILDYRLALADVLGSDSISSATSTVISGDVVINSQDVAAKSVTVWLAGGTAGSTSEIKIVAATSAGRTYEWFVTIFIQGA